jgi:hypothetical protein
VYNQTERWPDKAATASFLNICRLLRCPISSVTGTYAKMKRQASFAQTGDKSPHISGKIVFSGMMKRLRL